MRMITSFALYGLFAIVMLTSAQEVSSPNLCTDYSVSIENYSVPMGPFSAEKCQGLTVAANLIDLMNTIQTKLALDPPAINGVEAFAMSGWIFSDFEGFGQAIFQMNDDLPPSEAENFRLQVGEDLMYQTLAFQREFNKIEDIVYGWDAQLLTMHKLEARKICRSAQAPPWCWFAEQNRLLEIP